MRDSTQQYCKRSTGKMPIGPTGKMPVPRWPIARQNVGVKIDLHVQLQLLLKATGKVPVGRDRQDAYLPKRQHQNGFTGSGCGTFLPHFLQVRRASSFQKSSIA